MISKLVCQPRETKNCSAASQIVTSEAMVPLDLCFFPPANHPRRICRFVHPRAKGRVDRKFCLRRKAVRQRLARQTRRTSRPSPTAPLPDGALSAETRQLPSAFKDRGQRHFLFTESKRG